MSSLVVIDPRKLKTLLDEGGEWARLGEVFDETQLLWYNEGTWKTRMRSWRLIIKAAWRQMKWNAVKQWHAGQLWLGKGRFDVREVENTSTQGIARVKITAVLKRPEDAEDRHVVNEVIGELVKMGRRRLVRSRGEFLDKGIPWPKRPAHVFVALYRLDGSSRWLKGGGWLAGNTVAIAERTWGGRDPVFVDNPEEVYKGASVRYNIDADAALEAWRGVEKLAREIHGRQK